MRGLIRSVFVSVRRDMRHADSSCGVSISAFAEAPHFTHTLLTCNIRSSERVCKRAMCAPFSNVTYAFFRSQVHISLTVLAYVLSIKQGSTVLPRSTSTSRKMLQRLALMPPLAILVLRSPSTIAIRTSHSRIDLQSVQVPRHE